MATVHNNHHQCWDYAIIYIRWTMQGGAPSKLKGQLSGFQSGAVPCPLFNPHVCRLNQLKLSLIKWDQLSKGKPTVIHRFPMGVSCQCSLQPIHRFKVPSILYIIYISRHRTWASLRRQIAMSMIDAASALAARAHQQQLTTRLAYVAGGSQRCWISGNSKKVRNPPSNK